MILQHIQDLVAVCAAHGIRHAILSPGSRSAPISLAFNAHADIESKVVPDERSAAFIALGMAQQLNQTVALVCTSGSASLNYAPAIAEAYYQEIPLLVITADRPPEWVNQYDGQTIQQHNIYDQHAKAYYQLPVNPVHLDALWHTNRMVNEALQKTQSQPKGPVHINVPLREPFYPTATDTYNFTAARVIKKTEVISDISEKEKSNLKRQWHSAKTKWILVGQNPANAELTNTLRALSTEATIINEVTGNQHEISESVHEQDLLFQKDNWPHIQTPDLLITIGNSLISKNLKIFLRNKPAKAHWHIKHTDRVNDITQHLTQIIEASPERILSYFKSANEHLNTDLLDLNKAVAKKKKDFLKTVDFGELKAIDALLKCTPEEANIQLANSMAIRYANFLGIPGVKQRVNCNRGTSGIDGSSSTAVGAALINKQLTLLITGDLAFFYDRNAFWNNEHFPNLRIFVLNNDGGGIFNMIPGPTQQKDKEKIFLSPHGLTAEALAKEFDFGYHACHTEQDLERALKIYFEPKERPEIIEVFSHIEHNTKVLNQLKSIALID